MLASSISCLASSPLRTRGPAMNDNCQAVFPLLPCLIVPRPVNSVLTRTLFGTTCNTSILPSKRSLPELSVKGLTSGTICRKGEGELVNKNLQNEKTIDRPYQRDQHFFGRSACDWFKPKKQRRVCSRRCQKMDYPKLAGSGCFTSGL